MKQISTLFIAIVILLSFTLQTEAASNKTYYPGSKVEVKKGDIIVTKSTNCKDTKRVNCKGYTGHAGIVIDSKYIAHIAGPDKHPVKISIKDWLGLYKSTKVVRVNSKYRGNPSKAADWAAQYLKDYPNAEYVLPSNLITKNQTYCSKIVYQAYYYSSGGYPIVSTSGIVDPYSFVNKVGYGGSGSIVFSQNWK